MYPHCADAFKLIKTFIRKSSIYDCPVLQHCTIFTEGVDYFFSCITFAITCRALCIHMWPLFVAHQGSVFDQYIIDHNIIVWFKPNKSDTQESCSKRPLIENQEKPFR